MALLGRPLHGEVRIDLGHGPDAGERAVVVCIRAVLLPDAYQDLLGEGTFLLAACGRDRLPRRRRLRGLEQGDRHAIDVALVFDSGESVSFLADEDKPSSRKHPFEPEPALRVGGLRDRPGSVAAVEHFRANDRISVGADDPASNYGVGVDQHNLADVMSLAELAGQP